MVGKRRTELHEARAACYRAGATVEEIAAEEGVTVAIITRSLKLAGARLPARGARAWRAYRLRAHGFRWARIAEDMGASSAQALISAARRWALNHGLPWPEASLEALAQWERTHDADKD